MRRRLAAIRRRMELARLMRDVDVTVRGWKADLARTLGIHRDTLNNDLSELAKTAREVRGAKVDNEMKRSMEFAYRLENSMNPDVDWWTILSDPESQD